jgi:hypothetical protein
MFFRGLRVVLAPTEELINPLPRSVFSFRFCGEMRGTTLDEYGGVKSMEFEEIAF